jgi:hypothetical protein
MEEVTLEREKGTEAFEQLKGGRSSILKTS